MQWSSLPEEVRALLSPSFCAVMIWQAAVGYRSESPDDLPFNCAFLVLPLVLHRETREALPRSTVTSLAVWIEDNPLLRALLPHYARELATFSREAILFGGRHGLLTPSPSSVGASTGMARRVATVLRQTSEEVQQCTKKAEFVGKWFAKAGDAFTVMTVLGVRP